MAKAATPMRFHTNAIAATTQNDVGSLPFVISISLAYQPERSTSSTLVDFGIANMKALIIL